MFSRLIRWISYPGFVQPTPEPWLPSFEAKDVADDVGSERLIYCLEAFFVFL